MEAMQRHMQDKKVIWDSQHDSSKGKSCLTSLVSFCEGVTAMVDKGRQSDVSYMDLCKDFNSPIQHPCL